MKYIKDKTIYTYEISKSIFHAILIPLESMDELETILSNIKQTYPKANHYTYAYLYGPHGEQQGASDDGEPSRTAGIPILEVLKHHDVTNVIGVVVRYFGGIKLGAGGLVRAYTKAIADAIKDAKFYEKKIVECYEISFPYHLTHKIDQMEPNDIKILHKDFMEHITYKIILLSSDLSIFDEIKHQLISINKMAPEVLYIDL